MKTYLGSDNNQIIELQFSSDLTWTLGLRGHGPHYKWTMENNGLCGLVVEV